MDVGKVKTAVEELNELVNALSDEDVFLELDEDEITDQLIITYANGENLSAIHDLVRKIYLTDNELAKQMYRAFSYWISHEPDTDSKV